MKRIVFNILLFFCFLNLNAQNLDSAFSHFEKGNYEKAAAELEKTIPLIEKIYGKKDTSVYTLILFYTAKSYERINNFQKAESFYSRTREVYENQNAITATPYIGATSALADLYMTTGKFDLSEKLYLETLGRYEKLLGRESRNYINMVNSLGLLCQKSGRTAEAEEHFNRALALGSKVYGTYDSDYALILNNLATLYHESGKYSEARETYQKALEINLKISGPANPGTVSVLNNLGALYDDMGDYDKAASVYERVLQIRYDSSGPGHPDYALSLNNLAHLCFRTGCFEKSEALYRQALEIYRKTYGADHYTYAGTMNNLGALYHKTGHYELADSYYSEALAIRLKVFGEEHPLYATSLNNLALLYQETGDYGKAESCYEKSIEIRRKRLGTSHPDYASSLNNYALFCQETGKAEKAESLFTEAADIQKRNLGESHPDYAVTLNNLALFYSESKNYVKAELLFTEAIKVLKSSEGEYGSDYASALNNLASLYFSAGNLSKAEPMYRRSADIVSSLYGENHPEYASAVSNLALLYQEKGKIRKASEMYMKAMNAYLTQVGQQFSFMAETAKEKYLARLEFFFRTYQNFLVQNSSIIKNGAATAYDIELAFKGLLLNRERQLRMNIFSSGDTGKINSYQRWVTLRAALARQYSLPPGKRLPDLKPMENEADDLEKMMVRMVSGGSSFNSSGFSHWTDVKVRLSKGEAAIEFTCFPVMKKGEWTDSVMYYALLMRYDHSVPVIIPMFGQKQADRLLLKRTGSEESYINGLYRWSDSPVNSGSATGASLYDLVWKPLERDLSGINRIYYALSGRLNNISFSAIPCGKNQTLSDLYELRQVISTARVAELDMPPELKKLVLYGGIDYDASTDKMRESALRHQSAAGSVPVAAKAGTGELTESSRGGTFVYLDGTLSEIEMIRRRAEDSRLSATVISWDDAVEESLKDLQGADSPNLLHIATHGFFFGDTPKKIPLPGSAAKSNDAALVYRLSENPLMRSGLAFAGANNRWKGRELPSGINDGILTAYEVSGMYMPNTDLVVLSACETGLGVVMGSEGVYGLQRSFMIAGAGSVLMTLWQIPDYQTIELMNIFYQELFSGKSTDESLKQARVYMKGKYPGEPYKWGAFVLIR